MTSFNSPAVLMPLDDYYDHFVVPKPNIPKHYPGVTGNKKKKREAAHLQSYKDSADDDDDDDDEHEEEEDEPQQIDEFNSSIQDSNMNQISFETNEFNQFYEEETNGPIEDTTKNTNVTAITETIAESAKWRPTDAVPSVLSDAPRENPQAASGRAGRSRQRKRHRRFSSNNNRNNVQTSVHLRLGYNPTRNSQRAFGQLPMEQRMRNAYNAFNNNRNNNIAKANNSNMQQQVIMNMNNHFNNDHLQTWSLNSMSSVNVRPNYNIPNNMMASGYQRTNYNTPNNMIANQFSCISESSSNNNWIVDNTMTSLINTANQNCNNALTRLGPTPQTQLSDSMYGQREAGNFNTAGNGIVASDTLRLADLMNMDKSSCINLNVIEVAKSAMFLLSSVYHKPILNADVQQQLLNLKQSSGLPEEPHGIDMLISPKSTDLKMSHRFQ